MFSVEQEGFVIAACLKQMILLTESMISYVQLFWVQKLLYYPFLDSINKYMCLIKFK